MMRTENFDVTRFDGKLAGVAKKRMVEAMGVVVAEAKNKCPVGTVTRPMYKSGPYAGLPWTARDAGALKKTVRVVEIKGDGYGSAFAKLRSVRGYAGNYLRYYARIVEFYTPYLRPALKTKRSQIKKIMGVR